MWAKDRLALITIPKSTRTSHRYLFPSHAAVLSMPSPEGPDDMLSSRTGTKLSATLEILLEDPLVSFTLPVKHAAVNTPWPRDYDWDKVSWVESKPCPCVHVKARDIF